MSNTSKQDTKRGSATGRFLPVSKGAETSIKTFSPKETKGQTRPASLAERARRAAAAITDEEDAAITAAARTDPDAQPNRLIGRRPGRPRSASAKQPVMLRLDPDVVERFKAEGEGWQTRMNAALRKAAGLG